MTVYPYKKIPHEDLMVWDRAGRIAAGKPLIADWEVKPESVDREELGLAVVALVDEAQRLRQVIAVRHEADRREEQIKEGYR